ncbi:MAG: hypothetical protein AB7E70_21310 [Hyphomicrobiaceae bacterium]
MSHDLYTVTLTDLGTYTLTVAASTPREAESIAKSVLFEEWSQMPASMTTVKREAEAEAKAEPVATPPVREFRVAGRYSIQFEIAVPAGTASEAEQHAKRLYAENCGPYEFNTGEETVSWYGAREAQS